MSISPLILISFLILPIWYVHIYMHKGFIYTHVHMHNFFLNSMLLRIIFWNLILLYWFESLNGWIWCNVFLLCDFSSFFKGIKIGTCELLFTCFFWTMKQVELSKYHFFFFCVCVFPFFVSWDKYIESEWKVSGLRFIVICCCSWVVHCNVKQILRCVGLQIYSVFLGTRSPSKF